MPLYLFSATPPPPVTLRQHSRYRHHNRLLIPQDLIVPESNYAVAGTLQERRALAILLRLFGVLCAVYFNNQSPLLTTEIRDVGADRMLPPELRASQLAAAQSLPQLALSISLFPT